MNNFERITASPEVLADFLAALPVLSGPWDDDFHRTFCDSCEAENCDAENCPHQAERNNPAWWLKQTYTDTGPVKTDSPDPYKRQAADLRLEAMHQRGRFGRDLLAKELEGAAATIEALVEKLEAAPNDSGDTDLSTAPAEIKAAILRNDRLLKEREAET